MDGLECTREIINESIMLLTIPFVSDDTSLSTGKWESAWARLDGGRIALFDNDCLAENDGRAIMDIDLANTVSTFNGISIKDAYEGRN